jgi:hypothetical protein
MILDRFEVHEASATIPTCASICPKPIGVTRRGDEAWQIMGGAWMK